MSDKRRKKKKKKKSNSLKTTKAAARKAALENGEAWMPKRTKVLPDPKKEEERKICRKKVDPKEE